VPAWSEWLEFAPNWADKTALSQILTFLDLCLDLPNAVAAFRSFRWESINRTASF